MNALLEREIKKDEVKAQTDVIPAHTSSVEEDLHAQRMHENFKRLLGESGNVKDSAPVLTPEKEEVRVPDAAERMASFTRVEPVQKTSRRVLFENVTYKDGQVSGLDSAAAPAYTVVNMPAPMSAVAAASSAQEAETEDSLPTRRTMETLRHDAQKFDRASVMASISAKTKVVLATIALVIIMAITIICINTSLMTSLTADVASLESQAAALQTQASELQANIEEITSEESIVEWAIKNGMVRP